MGSEVTRLRSCGELVPTTRKAFGLSAVLQVTNHFSFPYPVPRTRKTAAHRQEGSWHIDPLVYGT